MSEPLIKLIFMIEVILFNLLTGLGGGVIYYQGRCPWLPICRPDGAGRNCLNC